MPKTSNRIACLIVLLACLPLVVSCVSKGTTASPELEDINYDIETVYTSIDALRESLDEQYAEICESQQTKLTKENEAVKRNLRSSQRRYARLEKRCETRNVIGKLLIGEVENVRLLNENLELSARIDTGAETSSLGVYRLQEFERDGKTWVKFKLVNKKSAPTYEYRVTGRVRIKQNANSEGDERFEIKMNIGIGNKDYPRQIFNLTDRSYLDHQVLIGRSFLTDVAIVDTGSKYRLTN